MPPVHALPVEAIVRALAAHPKSAAHIVYGTAGFRTKAALLDSTCFRIGLIGALRSKALDGKVVGLMVTASHNPEPDNGVKIVDARGEMLDAAWEPVCTRIANAATAEELVQELQHVVDAFQIDLSVPARVVYAWDTRPSSPSLVRAIVDGMDAIGAEKMDGGLLTTPQLHYLVFAYNTAGTPDAYGEPTEEGYYHKLGDAYLSATQNKPAPVTLVVDCANGVGAKSLQGLEKVVPHDRLPLQLLRTEMKAPGALNNGCGADFVKTNQKLPAGYDQESHVQQNTLLCSFDGDADRIVFYYLTGPPEKSENFHLLDGDRIAALAADYLSELVEQSGLDVQLGCVQTAYANGSSTLYLEKRVPVAFTPTGVKHLHHEAEKYDIGIYFEANGHGTVLFSKRAMQAIRDAKPSTPAAHAAVQQLAGLAAVINQTVGDAVSDMLMVLVILAARQWGPVEWDALYTDLPNRLCKVQVSDRTQFKTTDAERRLTSPAGMQAQIDALVAQYPLGRSFVRPSGTEDVVRVYAEAAKAEDVAALAKQVTALVETA
ncbi:phosphoacetylglucosamine mutase [Malassezia vespertilionis]|uniref:Phosphoacetylglucosamine mutase n=1 Tax=Malassezia vespertilionis TaxID=2020962 RepID=A0A2N1JHB6_9BASI|nr:phosphoacetylglucosamine mutase [Malassezia vespertilionis]PKI85946.1 Pcm1p [Malassezia vespertilionis]WFD05291.1 phosphoacetylglucosamine mutase [Malassezia vespertilionis]